MLGLPNTLELAPDGCLPRRLPRRGPCGGPLEPESRRDATESGFARPAVCGACTSSHVHLYPLLVFPQVPKPFTTGPSAGSTLAGASPELTMQRAPLWQGERKPRWEDPCHGHRFASVGA